MPIACTLSAADLQERLREMADLGREALLDARREGVRAELRFAPGVPERVEAIAAAESRCCAFLELHVAVEPDAVVLSVVAPDGAESVLAEWLDAFAASAA